MGLADGQAEGRSNMALCMGSAQKPAASAPGHTRQLHAHRVPLPPLCSPSGATDALYAGVHPDVDSATLNAHLSAVGYVWLVVETRRGALGSLELVAMRAADTISPRKVKPQRHSMHNIVCTAPGRSRRWADGKPHAGLARPSSTSPPHSLELAWFTNLSFMAIFLPPIDLILSISVFLASNSAISSPPPMLLPFTIMLGTVPRPVMSANFFCSCFPRGCLSSSTT